MQTFLGFLDSNVFLALQITGGILSVFLGVAATVLIIKGGAPQRHILHLWIAWKKGPLPKPKILKKWHAIEKVMERKNPKGWRKAIAEADLMLDEILQKIGYEGDTIEDRLAHIPTTLQFPALEDAWRAHQINKFLLEDPNYPLTYEVAERTIEIYKNIFKETGVIA